MIYLRNCRGRQSLVERSALALPLVLFNPLMELLLVEEEEPMELLESDFLFFIKPNIPLEEWVLF